MVATAPHSMIFLVNEQLHFEMKQFYWRFLVKMETVSPKVLGLVF
jgi:hypothetical protein